LGFSLLEFFFGLGNNLGSVDFGGLLYGWRSGSCVYVGNYGDLVDFADFD
jgi:hypothetical protein